MERETKGTVVAFTRQWWLKINTKPIRAHALDGAVFPHVVKVKYTAGERDYTCRKWINAGIRVPAVGESLKVFYPEERPSKGKIAL